MARLYNAGTDVLPLSMQRLTGQFPIEDRNIVQYKEDLKKKSTWGSMVGPVWQLPVYKGMSVFVVSDNTESNNGLYFFKKAVSEITSEMLNNSEYFGGSQENAERYFDDYWMKIGGSDVKFDEDTIQQNPTAPIDDPNDPDYDPNATDQDNTDDEVWYANHVKRVYGGSWESDEPKD